MTPSLREQRSDAAFAAWNEEMVQRYDIERYYAQSNALIRWLEQRRLSLLAALAAAAAGERVLEVGCGAGHVLARFAQARRVGVDLSSTMLGRARVTANSTATKKKFPASSPAAAAICSTLMAPAYPGKAV